MIRGLLVRRREGVLVKQAIGKEHCGGLLEERTNGGNDDMSGSILD